MAKKTDSSSKPAVPEKPPIATKAPAKAPAKRKVVAKSGKAPAAKKAKAATKTTKPAKPSKPAYTRDDIALRAYFISEKRHANGWPGNEHLDWVEAERQLHAEAGKGKRTKKA